MLELFWTCAVMFSWYFCHFFCLSAASYRGFCSESSTSIQLCPLDPPDSQQPPSCPPSLHPEPPFWSSSWSLKPPFPRRVSVPTLNMSKCRKHLTWSVPLMFSLLILTPKENLTIFSSATSSSNISNYTWFCDKDLKFVKKTELNEQDKNKLVY